MDEAVPPTHSAGDRGGPDAAGATRKNEAGPNAAGATRHHCGSLRRRQSGPGGGPLRRSKTFRTQVRPEACRLLKNSSCCPGLTASIPAARGVEAASLRTCRFAFRAPSGRHRKRCLGGTSSRNGSLRTCRFAFSWRFEGGRRSEASWPSRYLPARSARRGRSLPGGRPGGGPGAPGTYSTADWRPRGCG